ncbi:MAG: hypothetical protein ACRYFX_02625 [Janthinobacterium lividum]
MSLSDYDLLLSDAAPDPTSTRPSTRICPKCGYTVPCYRPTESQYFGCLHCHQFFRVLPGQVTQAVRKFGPPGAAPALALGSVGTLGGYQLRITGCQLRSEKKDPKAQWLEYQLSPADAATAKAAAHNPAFPVQLAEYQGHWQLVRPASGISPNVPKRGDVWKDPNDSNRPYRLWHRYQPLVLDAQGEFDWNVLDDEQLQIVELTSPPYLLSGEQPPGKAYTWYRSHYLEPAQVAAAFGLSTSQLPARLDIGASQPPLANATWSPLKSLTWAALVVLLALQAVLLRRGIPPLLSQDFIITTPTFRPADTLAARTLRAQIAATTDTIPAHLTPTSTSTYVDLERNETARIMANARLALLNQQLAALTTKTSPTVLVSHSFTVDGPAALYLQLKLPGLNNNWAEVALSLVDEQTGRTYEATKALEYYSGVQGGESWSEGDNAAGINFSAVPAGRYHCNLYPSTDPQKPADGALHLYVEPNYGLWGNFWLTLAVLLAPLTALYIGRYFHEQARWSNSNYGPEK